MAAIMPAVPRFYFLYVEPALCVLAAFQPILDPHAISDLLPFHMGGRRDFNPDLNSVEMLLSLQVSKLLFEIMVINFAVMSYGHKAPKLVHTYVLASALTEFPHWASLTYVLGWEGLASWRIWSPQLWLSVTVPFFMLLVKGGYLLGVFGPDKVLDGGKKRA